MVPVVRIEEPVLPGNRRSVDDVVAAVDTSPWWALGDGLGRCGQADTGSRCGRAWLPVPR